MKWEYCSVRLGVTDNDSLESGLEALNEMGRVGWELVSVIPEESKTDVYDLGGVSVMHAHGFRTSTIAGVAILKRAG